jgi:hypothetical protein
MDTISKVNVVTENGVSYYEVFYNRDNGCNGSVSVFFSEMKDSSDLIEMKANADAKIATFIVTSTVPVTPVITTTAVDISKLS